MSAYIILFLLMTALFFASVFLKKRHCVVCDLLFGFVVFVFVGLRDRVGGDWENYNKVFNSYIVNKAELNFEPAFDLILQVMTYFNHDLFGQFVNIYYISLFLFFFYLFNYQYLRNLKINFSVLQLAWVIFPVFLFLQTTGYIRQAVACLFVIPIYHYAIKQKYFKSCVFVLAATIFHKSALVCFLIPGLIFLMQHASKKQFFKHFFKENYILLSSLLLVLMLSLIFLINHWGSSYIDGQLTSKGVIFRWAYLLMLVSPLVLLNRSMLLIGLKKYWHISFLAFMFVAASSYYFSTLVDRYLLYFFLPIAIFVIAKLSPDNEADKRLVGFYVFMFFINITYSVFWLKYSIHGSTKWLPFCNQLLGCYQ